LARSMRRATRGVMPERRKSVAPASDVLRCRTHQGGVQEVAFDPARQCTRVRSRRDLGPKSCPRCPSKPGRRSLHRGDRSAAGERPRRSTLTLCHHRGPNCCDDHSNSPAPSARSSVRRPARGPAGSRIRRSRSPLGTRAPWPRPGPRSRSPTAIQPARRATVKTGSAPDSAAHDSAARGLRSKASR